MKTVKLATFALLLMVPACSGGGDVRLEGSSVEVSIDVFSGRPNPTFDLGGSELALLEEKLRNLQPGNEQPTQPGLGYRGFLIPQSARVVQIGNGSIVEQASGRVRVYRDSHDAEAYLKAVAETHGYGGLLSAPIQRHTGDNR